MRPLSIQEFTEVSVIRCEDELGFNSTLGEWSPTDWACALAGEVGEACNLIKKLRRLGRNPGPSPARDVLMQGLADELGDVQAYLCLLAARMGIDLAEATARKFDMVSERTGYPVKLMDGAK